MLVFIEMPAGTIFKYEKNPATSQLHVDRVLKIPVPHSYGFVPGTMEPDGDPLDVFVVASQPLAQGCTVNVVPRYRIEMTDNGVRDDKIVAELKGDVRVEDVQVEEIMRYLTSYKDGIYIIRAGPVK